ncbi:hypothetical protein FG05_35047 [Fusarium graminearum]|nr:hypothetical protein FG05_35047 [Fusarium graminearum]
MGVGVSETTGYDDMYVYEVPYPSVRMRGARAAWAMQRSVDDCRIRSTKRVETSWSQDGQSTGLTDCTRADSAVHAYAHVNAIKRDMRWNCSTPQLRNGWMDGWMDGWTWTDGRSRAAMRRTVQTKRYKLQTGGDYLLYFGGL